MADIDADLLALAGGFSSDEADNFPTTKAQKSSSPTGLGLGQNGSKGKPGPGSSKRASTGGSGRKIKKAAQDDSEEEGEASSVASFPDSLRSAAMSESDSDSSSKAFDDMSFPFENKYKSLEEKKYINSLSEIQREEILAERAAQVEREQQSRVLRELLKNRERGGSKADKKKRKADEDIEDGNRKTSRQRTTLGGRKVGETSAPLEEYKRQREQRGKENEQRRRDDANRPSKRKDDDSSDADADGESDVEWDDGRVKSGASHNASSPVREMRAVVLRDYDRIRIGHEQFAQVCFYPGFEKAISGCYARINMGPDKATGVTCYRMALVKGFTDGKAYAMHPANGQPFITTQHVVAAMGKAERIFPFLAFSMSNFTEAEFNRYKTFVEAEGIKLPDLHSLQKKIGDINGLVNRTWTDDEITEKIKRSGVKANRDKPFEMARLGGLRKEAVANGDNDAVTQIDAELAALEEGKLAYGTSLSKHKDEALKGPSQQDRLALLNRANRKANTEDIRRAQLAEKKAEREAAAAVARGEQAPNAFARVKTRAKVHYDVNDTGPPPGRNYLGDASGDDRSRANTPMRDSRSGTPVQLGTPKRSGTPLLGVPGQKSEKKGIPTFRRRIMDDEAIASMGIEIDI